MTTQDDVAKNLENPLFLRSPINGGEDRVYRDEDANVLNLMRWAGPWDPNRGYYKNEVTRDGDWLMIAIKPNQDRPSPQPNGSPTFCQPDPQSFTEDTFTGTIDSGTIYNFTEGGFLEQLDVWVPSVSADENYQLYVVNETDPASPIAQILPLPTLTANQWVTARVGSEAVPAGTVLRIFLKALNSGANTVVSGGWQKAADTNDATIDPGASNWGTRTNNTSFRINKTDLDTVDRSTELSTIGSGSTITMVDTAAAERSQTWSIQGDPVDEGTHYSWSAINYTGGGSLGIPAVGATCTITATIPVPSPTKAVRNVGWWAANQPTWATVQGYYATDGTSGASENDSHGVRLRFQPAIVSPNWQAVSYFG